MDKTPGFQCAKCGACCRQIHRIPQLAALDNGSGVCVNLKGNLCCIYPSRPEVCNVDAMYEKYYRGLCTKEQFYQMNQYACMQIQKHSKS